MPRRKEYEPDDALGKAIRAFWKNGYAATTVRDLEEAMGVNRFGIQTFFGGKDKLFDACLDKYLAGTEEVYLAEIRRGGLDAIRAFFEMLADPDKVLPENAFGCLLVNTLAEPLEQDKTRIRPQVRRYLDRLKDAFRGALDISRDRGELKSGLDRDASADFLVTLVLGMQAKNRGAQSVSASQTTIEVLRAVLDSWRR